MGINLHSNPRTLSISYGSSLSQLFKISVLKNFANFAGKHLCRSPFRSATLLKRDSSTGVLMRNLRNFEEHLLFYRTTPVAVSISYKKWKTVNPTQIRWKTILNSFFSLRFLDVFVGELDPNLLKTLCNQCHWFQI